MADIAMENHNFSWENQLLLWPFSIAMLNYQRVIHWNVGISNNPDLGIVNCLSWGSLNGKINKYHLGIPFSHGNIRDGLVVGFSTLCFQLGNRFLGDAANPYTITIFFPTQKWII